MKSKLNNQFIRKIKIRNILNLFCIGLIQKNTHKLFLSLLLLGFTFNSIAQSGIGPVDSLPERNPYIYSYQYNQFLKSSMSKGVPFIKQSHIRDMTWDYFDTTYIKSAIVFNDRPNTLDTTLIYTFNKEGYLIELFDLQNKIVNTYAYKSGVLYDSVFVTRRFARHKPSNYIQTLIFNKSSGVIEEIIHNLQTNYKLKFDNTEFGRCKRILQYNGKGFREIFNSGLSDSIFTMEDLKEQKMESFELIEEENFLEDSTFNLRIEQIENKRKQLINLVASDSIFIIENITTKNHVYHYPPHTFLSSIAGKWLYIYYDGKLIYVNIFSSNKTVFGSREPFKERKMILSELEETTDLFYKVVYH